MIVPNEDKQQTSLSLPAAELRTLDAQHFADVVERSGNVNVEVGVNAARDRACAFYDGHRHPFSFSSSQGVARATHSCAAVWSPCWRRAIRRTFTGGEYQLMRWAQADQPFSGQPWARIWDSNLRRVR